MNQEMLSRREVLQWLALGGAYLGTTPFALAAGDSGATAAYPAAKVLRDLAKEGWTVEYKKADVRREGMGLRAPSVIPPERYVSTPAIVEARFQGSGKWRVVMPSFAHVCNQTALATRVEIEAAGSPLKRGRDYTLKPLVTRPAGNRFWQVEALVARKKGPIKIRVVGYVSNAAEPADREAARKKIAQIAAQPNEFEKRYRVKPERHWLKKPSQAVEDAATGVQAEDPKNRFEAILHIVREMNKKGKLSREGKTRDPEEFVKDGLKGSCGANADFVNYAATAAGYPNLFYTEGYIVIPRLNYLGLHAWNTACCNGLFIADSLNPDLVLPEYSGYVATSVGPNLGHPHGPHATTNGGWATGTGRFEVRDYYVYFSMPGYGVHGERLNKMETPAGIRQLADFVERQRRRVNKR
jgi:hypothetical protein